MRPFKFFFVLALAVFAFTFVAKFFIMAFFVAAIMSTVYFVFTKIRNFFFRMTWDRSGYGEYEDDGYHRQFAERRYQAEPLFYKRERQPQWQSDYRSITIH